MECTGTVLSVECIVSRIEEMTAGHCVKCMDKKIRIGVNRSAILQNHLAIDEMMKLKVRFVVGKSK